MTKSRSKITRNKWILGIISFLVAIWLLSTLALDPFVKNLLIKQVASQTQGKYYLEIDAIDCSIMQRKVHLFSPRLVPHTDYATGSQTVYSLHVDELELKGIQLWRLIWNEEFIVNHLNISDPEVVLKKGLNVDSLNNVGAKGRTGGAPLIQIGAFNLDKGKLTVLGPDSTEIMAFADATISLESFIYDEKGLSPQSFDFDNFSLSVKDYSMILPDSFYRLQASAITASAQSKDIAISSIALIPLYEQQQFMEKKGEQTDRMNVFVKELLVEGLDFDRILKKEFVASFVTIDSLNLVAYRDKRYILPADKYVKFPQQALREFPHYVHIDSVLLHNAQITYRERVEGGEEPGHINFVNINALTNNVTNDMALLDDSIAMVTHATGYLMGAGKITAHIHIPIGNEQNVHYFEGTMSPMEMKAVNPMLRNIVFGEVVSGRVNGLSFSAHLNEDESQGTMRFGYEDLKVQINHEESEKGRKGLISFIANTFIVKSENPSSDEFRVSEMHYVRDKRKSLINFWWKTLLSGLKDTMGVPEGNEKDKPES